jgi:hypothetical protein
MRPVPYRDGIYRASEGNRLLVYGFCGANQQNTPETCHRFGEELDGEGET